MKTKAKILISTVAIVLVFVTSLYINKSAEIKPLTATSEKGCVFMTTFGEQPSSGYAQFKIKYRACSK